MKCINCNTQMKRIDSPADLMEHECSKCESVCVEKILKETEDDSPSVNEDARIEDLYDSICSDIGFDDSTKELRDKIRLFGKLRFNQKLPTLDQLDKGEKDERD